MTQTELAQKLGCSISTVCRMVGGKEPRIMKRPLAEACHGLMGRSPSWWMTAPPGDIAARVSEYLAKR